MPKKLSTNPKALEARERKEEKKRVEQSRKEEAEENARWAEDDPNVLKKLQRKAEQEKKRLEAAAKKLEKKTLYEEEMGKVGGKPTSDATNKVTRSEITDRLDKERREKEEQLKQEKLAKERIAIQDLPEENVNLIQVEGDEARTVDEAIQLLSNIGVGSGSKSEEDRHPEKRMKAAYATFEEANLPRLKQENPTLRLSQLKQLLKKEWMKHPENPLNKAMLSKS